MHKLLGLAPLLLGACFFQGPWDYSPKLRSNYAGLELNAMLVAGRSVQGICIERMYGLNEEYSPAFAWYRSVQLQINGPWSDGTQKNLSLVANPLEPSCFQAQDLTLKPVAGGKYQLSAVVEWDSAGTGVKNSISAQMQIPLQFGLQHQLGALVNKAADPGAAKSSTTPLASGDLMSAFNTLPDSARIKLLAKWGDTLLIYQADTVKLQSLLPQVLADADSLSKIYETRWRYSDGDTVLYLTGNLNNRPHFFLSKYDSPSLGGVLITQRLDSTGMIPENSFSAISKRFNGGLVSPRSLAFAGTVRPILSYPNQKLRGVPILDSISVLNTYLFGGRNVLYFYGVDSSYQKYVDTYVQGQQDPKNIPVFNVQGAWGYFSGAVVDSMTIHVKIPDGIQKYSYFETKADQCAPQIRAGTVVAEGWSTPYCRAFEGEYCQTVEYNERDYAQKTKLIGQYSTGKWTGYSDCKIQSVRHSLDSNWGWNDLAQKWNLGEISTEQKLQGTLLSCMDKDLNASYCSEVRDSTLAKTPNPLNKSAWNYCLDRKWPSGNLCAQIMVSYVRVGKSTARVLQDQVQKFCKAEPSNPYCKL